MVGNCLYKTVTDSGSLSEKDLATISIPQSYRLELWSITASAGDETELKFYVDNKIALVLRIPAAGTIEISKRDGEFVVGTLQNDNVLKMAYRNINNAAEVYVTVCYRLTMQYDS